MSILVHIGNFGKASEELRGVILRISPPVQASFTSSLEELRYHLAKQGLDLDTAILFAGSDTELTALLNLRDQLDGLRLILIVPGLDAAITAFAHQIHPRFLTTPSQGLKT